MFTLTLLTVNKHPLTTQILLTKPVFCVNMGNVGHPFVHSMLGVRPVHSQAETGYLHQMNHRWLILILLAAVLSTTICSNCLATGTTAIEQVRTKTSLSAGDQTIIDNFLADAVRDILNTTDFASVAQIRSSVLSMSRSQSTPYVQQFIESTRKHVSSGMSQAASLPADRRDIVRMNLLILIDTLEDVRLLDLPLKMLGDRNTIVRYWAVRCLTSDTILKALSSTANTQLAQSIAEEMTRYVNQANADTLRLMTNFAGRIPGPQALNLLTKIADTRIARYESWKVQHELLDATILKYLGVRLATAPPQSKSGLAMRFSQLYSDVFLRYLKGKGAIALKSREQLAAVLIEVEDKSLKTLLGGQTQAIRRAIEAESDNDLLQEYVRLFGNDTQIGLLAQKFSFEYTRQGQPNRKTPYPLPNPPAAPATN